MFSKLAFFTAASMAVFVAAAPWAGDGVSGSCNTGPVQCCNSVQNADAPGISSLLALVGASVNGLTGQVGVTCSPISVIGGGVGSDCTAQPVCCSNNSFNGVVALGCTPINVGL
ncbi:hydrophobin-251, partial [Pholiota molesta]